MDLPVRKKLPHTIPQWVSEGSWFFITINCEPRGKNHLCQTDGLGRSANPLTDGSLLVGQVSPLKADGAHGVTRPTNPEQAGPASRTKGVSEEKVSRIGAPSSGPARWSLACERAGSETGAPMLPSSRSSKGAAGTGVAWTKSFLLVRRVTPCAPVAVSPSIAAGRGLPDPPFGGFCL